MTAVVLFIRKGKRYRMRVARAHLHPGERDRFEIASKDMMDQIVWSPVPDGSLDVPSGEWLTRRVLWHLLENGYRPSGPSFIPIDLGELEV